MKFITLPKEREEAIERGIRNMRERFEKFKLRTISAGVTGAIATKIVEPATVEEIARRVAVCNTCDQLDSARKCNAMKCKCFVDQKARLSKYACPLGKWKLP